MSDYTARILDAWRVGNLPGGPGSVTSVEVEHGPHCLHRSSGRCTCHPRITAVAGDHVLVIGSGGAVLERSKRQ